jgi:hypothetical protein
MREPGQISALIQESLMKKQSKKLVLAKETVRSLEGIRAVRGGSYSGPSCDPLETCPDEFQPLTWVRYTCSC